MTRGSILARLTTECPFSEVFQDTEKMEDSFSAVPRLKIGHIRADYNGRWWNTVWPCHIELATDAAKREIDEVYEALTAKDALADLDTLTRFCKSHPEACVDSQFRQEYIFTWRARPVISGSGSSTGSGTTTSTYMHSPKADGRIFLLYQENPLTGLIFGGMLG